MWRSLVRSGLSNVAGTLVALVVGFITMPLVVHHLGPAQFGLWVLATGIVGGSLAHWLARREPS